MHGPDGARVDAAVGRVAARMRTRVALSAATGAMWGLGLASLPVIVATRLGWLDHTQCALVLGLSALVAILTVWWRARPVPKRVAAAAADQALSLSDRLTSAIAFLSDPEPTPLMELAIADGARVGAALDPTAVVGLGLPRSAKFLPLLAIVVVLLAILQLPAHPVAQPPEVHKPRLVVEKDALDAEREALKKLREENKGKDPRMADLARELDKVLEQIDQQKLSRAEAFQKLADLEKKIELENAATPPPPTKELAALQKALASSRATKDVAKALEKDDLGEAQQQLEKLAAEAEQRAKQEHPNAKEEEAQRELSRALDKASKALDEARKKQEEERDKQIEQLKEEERRLKKEQQERPDDQETERKLKRNQRELERLEREKQAQKEQQRQLERLSRDLQKAAEQLRSKMSPEAMKRAAEQLGKMEDEIRKLGSSAQQMMQIGELKEVLRRAGKVQQGDGQPQSGQGNAQRPGQGQKKQNGKGGNGQGDEREQRMAEFDERAGGEPNALILGGDDPGQGSVMLPLPMGQGPGDKPGGEGGPGKDPGDPERNGDGIGTEHNPNLFGDKTHNKTNTKLIHAKGKAGAGPSKSQTILGAAEKGFSSRDYSRVYKDYSSVVEEVMSQQGVPPGYRYYVKRYFQLIRPRE